MLLGGVLTGTLDWHWIFLVNIPIGAAVIVSCSFLLPVTARQRGVERLDGAGSVTVTAALLIAVYAIMDGNHAGWGSVQTIGLLIIALLLLAVFLRIESRAASPVMPLALFRLRSLATANVVGVLWAGAMFAWFFLSALYFQLVLGYSPLGVGLALLPANLIMGAFSLGLSERIVLRFGIRAPLAIGMSLVAASLALYARAPVSGDYAVDVLPGMILLGLGMGVSLNPMLLAAMSEVEPGEAGLASGVANTSFMMGGALGLAVLASLADARTETLSAAGVDRLAALTGGYHAAFVVGGLFAATAAALAALLLRPSGAAPPDEDRDILTARATVD
ncbi:MAG: hypothetical protein QOJ06_1274 [Pseudonocardiales bacterium]|nr:hypothetical protein [Pseudonocardiales bacterium]